MGLHTGRRGPRKLNVSKITGLKSPGASMDSRMGLLSVVVPILMGMCFFFVVDVDEGIRVAKEVDDEAMGVVEE